MKFAITTVQIDYTMDEVNTDVIVVDKPSMAEAMDLVRSAMKEITESNRTPIGNDDCRYNRFEVIDKDGQHKACCALTFNFDEDDPEAPDDFETDGEVYVTAQEVKTE